MAWGEAACRLAWWVQVVYMLAWLVVVVYMLALLALEGCMLAWLAGEDCRLVWVLEPCKLEQLCLEQHILGLEELWRLEQGLVVH